MHLRGKTERRTRGIQRARYAGAMNNTVSTATEEREQWRARILRALAELRGDDVALRGQLGDDEREDGSTRDG